MIFIHWPSFTGDEIHGGDAHNYCGYPAFRAYTANEGGTSIFGKREIEDATKEEAHVAKRAVDTRLVISSEPSHNATALCESKTSRGPDFISLAEKVYCNMVSRSDSTWNIH
jgi:hypothetical protein